MRMTNIYYFSGTGNSLYVARELCKRIPNCTLQPIVKLLKQHDLVAESDIVGLVFPIYINSTPIPVREFIKKIQLKPNQFIFVVATHCGYPGKVELYLEKLLKKKNKTLDAYYKLKMMGNTPKGLVPSFMVAQDWSKKITKKAILSLDEKVQKELDYMAKAITEKEKNTGENNPDRPNVLLRFANRLLQVPMQWNAERTNAQIGFYADSTCTGCGLCAQVCPSYKVKMEQNKPVWQKEVRCYYCYACFNFCPEQAILIKDYTHKEGRYIHPGIEAQDIADQKE